MDPRSYSRGSNHFDLDPDLAAILDVAGSPVDRGRLRRFGGLAGGEALRVGDHVDHRSPPVLLMHDLDGERVDQVILDPGEAALLPRLASMNRPPFEGGSWREHFACGFLLGDPGLYCILIITNQTAYVIHKYAPEHASWKERLLAGDAWGATWMTEVHAGSDLGANKTRAELDGSRWRLTGEKYFASGAGLADMAVVTARPAGAPPGAKGLALFLVPRRDSRGCLNFKVRRLKDKSATRAVPSGEVELEGSEAFLVGRPELGIYYTLETLTVARLANAAAAMGIARKAQLEAAFRVRSRRAFGAVLEDHPLVRRDLTDLAVRTAGGLALTFRAVEAFDLCWEDRPPYTPAYHFARLLAHLAKGRTADHAAECSRLAMELFGGLGFLEEYAVARWHREALITPIWEGAANIQALDMLEALDRKGAGEMLLAELGVLLSEAGTPQARLAEARARTAISGLKEAAGGRAAEWLAKDALVELADAVQVALLYRLAKVGGERYAKLATLYATRFLGHEPYPGWAESDAEVWSIPLGSVRGPGAV